MNWGETASAVMIGMLAAQMAYGLMRYSFQLITGISLDRQAENVCRHRP